MVNTKTNIKRGRPKKTLTKAKVKSVEKVEQNNNEITESFVEELKSEVSVLETEAHKSVVDDTNFEETQDLAENLVEETNVKEEADVDALLNELEWLREKSDILTKENAELVMKNETLLGTVEKLSIELDRLNARMVGKPINTTEQPKRRKTVDEVFGHTWMGQNFD